MLGDLSQDKRLVCYAQDDAETEGIPYKFASRWVAMAREEVDLGDVSGDEDASTRGRSYLVFFALALLCALLSGCSPWLAGSTKATVYRVTDGDTVKISPEINGENTVRLIGVDTPETNPGQGVQPLGPEATAFSEANLLDEEVSLEFDAERKDDYDRLLAYVYLPDGTMFNETLLREGYAQVATFPPNTRYVDRFEDAQEEAREAGRGIWGLPEGELCQLRDRGNGIGGGCR